jgi:hypothetical protein
MKTQRLKIANLALGLTTISVAAAALCLALPAHAGVKAAPGHSSAFGNSLATWEETWFRWAFGDITVPVDANANALVGDATVLLPTPSTPGDGTPGHLTSR